MTRPRGVHVGCTFYSLRVVKGHLTQATCSCGWEGPRRRSIERAGADLEKHSGERGDRDLLVCDRCGHLVCLEGDLMCEKANSAGVCSLAEWDRRQMAKAREAVAGR